MGYEIVLMFLVNLVAALPAPAWRPADAAGRRDRRMNAWMDHPPQVGNNVACAMTCHTALPFAAARRELGDSPALARLRARIEERVASAERWHEATPFYGTSASARGRESLASEAVLNAAALALDDRAAGQQGSDVARRAFDRMWQMQRADGGFDWLDFGLDPWESGKELLGASYALLAVGAMPDADVPAEPKRKLVAFAQAHVAGARLHDRLALLWAASDLDALDPNDAAAIVAEAAQRQASDGSFTWRDLGIARGSGAEAYPTALATLAVCMADRAGSHARPAGGFSSAAELVARGREWLIAAQRSDGSWATRSPNRDRSFSHAIMSDAATAYAVMALHRCR